MCIPDIRQALDLMSHRGPDDSGLVVRGHAFIGSRRLSIIDTKRGHQPVFNEDQTICAALNGEIYNYVELMHDLKSKGHCFRSECDTEVVVHLFEEYREELVHYLRGMFAIAIWDDRRKEFHLARDRFGKKPLYLTQPESGGMIFASELKALKALALKCGEHWEIRKQSIYDYLSLGFVPQPDTIYEGVSVAQAATWMTYDGRDMKSRRYWSLSYSPKLELTYPEVLLRTRSMIREAVRIRLRSDVPLGVFLSGGIDSSIVASEAREMLGAELHTFTIAVGDPRLDESPVAFRTARQLAVKNTVLRLEMDPVASVQFLVRQYDQPFADSSAIPNYWVSKLAREHVKVVLNGDGGDEIFGGYRRYLATRFLETIRPFGCAVGKAFAAISSFGQSKRRSAYGFLKRFLRGLGEFNGSRYLIWTTDMLRESDKQAYWLTSGHRPNPTEKWIEAFHDVHEGDLDNQMRCDNGIILPSALLVKMDMATMAASLEARSPFLDHLLAEFAARLPGSVLLKGGRTKAVLRDAYRNILPSEVIRGPKRGFEVPMESWLRKDLRPLVADTLESENSKLSNYLDAKFIRQLLNCEIMSDRNMPYIVYSLLVLELWLRHVSSETPESLHVNLSACAGRNI